MNSSTGRGDQNTSGLRSNPGPDYTELCLSLLPPIICIYSWTAVNLFAFEALFSPPSQRLSSTSVLNVWIWSWKINKDLHFLYKNMFSEAVLNVCPQRLSSTSVLNVCPQRLSSFRENIHKIVMFVLNVACPQCRLSSTSPVLNVLSSTSLSSMSPVLNVP